MRTDCIMVTVKQTGNRFSFHYSALYDLLAVLYLHMYVLVIIWFNLHQRSKFT